MVDIEVFENLYLETDYQGKPAFAILTQPKLSFGGRRKTSGVNRHYL
jgi:hypothetical protein